MAKLDALEGGLFLNFEPPVVTGLSFVTFPRMACVAAQTFEVTKSSMSPIVIFGSSI